MGRETTKSLAELQYLDLINVGIVMLSLLCRQQIPAHGIQQALGYLSSRVSVPLFNAFTFIFTPKQSSVVNTGTGEEMTQTSYPVSVCVSLVMLTLALALYLPFSNLTFTSHPTIHPDPDTADRQ